MNEQDKTNTTETVVEKPTNELSKVAESINKVDNPLEERRFDEFVLEPIIKKEEEKKEETEVKAEVKTEEKPVVETKTEEKKETTEEKVEPKITENDIINFLNTSIEGEFGSVEEIKSLIAEHKKYKEIEKELVSLTREDRARMEIGREYGDYTLYDKVMSIDTTKIAHTPEGYKEILKQAYFLDNTGKNPQYLEKAFEKQFTNTYEAEADQEFSKLQLQEDGQEAIQKILETQEEFKKLGQISGVADPVENQKLKEAEDNKWFAAVDSVLENTDRIVYDLGNGQSLNVVMDAKDKQMFQNSMDEPLPWLLSIIKDKGIIDHEALFELQFGYVYRQKIVEEAMKLGAALYEEKLLKEKKNTAMETGKTGSIDAEPPMREVMAQGLRGAFNL